MVDIIILDIISGILCLCIVGAVIYGIKEIIKYDTE